MTPGDLYVKVNISAWRFESMDKAPAIVILCLERGLESLCNNELCVCVFTNVIPTDTSRPISSKKGVVKLVLCHGEIIENQIYIKC